MRQAFRQKIQVGRLDACDAPMESTNGTLKLECVHGEHFGTRAEPQQAIVESIGYYYTVRRHSSLGFVSPAEFERRRHANAISLGQAVSR